MTLVDCPAQCGAVVSFTEFYDRPSTVSFCCVPCWNTFAAANGIGVGEDERRGHSQQCEDRQALRRGIREAAG